MSTSEKAFIILPGVLPNEDDFTGYWGLTQRTIVSSFSPKISDREDKEDLFLQALKEGNFEVQLEECESTAYIGDVLGQGHIMSVANTSSSLQQFYDRIVSLIHEVGYQAYVEEFALEPYGNEFLDENGVNGAAFEILIYDGANSKLHFEVID